LEHAEALIAEILALDPGAINAFWARSYIRGHELRNDDALADIDWAVKLAERPGSGASPDQLIRLHRQRTAILNSMGRYEEAEQAAKRVIALKPDYHESHYDLAALASRAERPREVIEHLDRAIRAAEAGKSAKNAAPLSDYYYLRALNELNLGNKLQESKEAVRIRESEPHFKAAAEDMVKARQFEAVAVGLKLATIHSESPIARVIFDVMVEIGLGDVDSAAGHDAAAEVHYRAARDRIDHAELRDATGDESARIQSFRNLLDERARSKSKAPIEAE
jgi:tetratricopeptide (TPR) repeat protein